MSFFSSIGNIAKNVGSFLNPLSSVIDIGSTILGAKAQEDTNEQNIELARETRDWEEKMANTAFQRARTDLEKAGLNPMLAIGKAAPVPSVTAPRVESPGSIISQGGHSAVSNSLQQQSLASAIQVQRTQADLNSAQASAIRAEIPKKELSGKVAQQEESLRLDEVEARKKVPKWLRNIGTWGKDLGNTLSAPARGLFGLFK